ncbi:hypothetical protein ABK040_012315 [Willaertia magna]
MFKSVVKKIKYEQQFLQHKWYLISFNELKKSFLTFWRQLYVIILAYLNDYKDIEFSICFFTKFSQKSNFIVMNQDVVNDEIYLVLNKFINLSKYLLNFDEKQPLYNNWLPIKLQKLFFEFIFKGINNYKNINSDNNYKNIVYNDKDLKDYNKNTNEMEKDLKILFNSFTIKYNYVLLINYLQNNLYSFNIFCKLMENIHNSTNLEIYNLLILQPNLNANDFEKLTNKYFYKLFVLQNNYFEYTLQFVLTTKKGNLNTKKEIAIYLMSTNTKQLPDEFIILNYELKKPFNNDFEILDNYCKLCLNNDIEKIDKLFLKLKNCYEITTERIKRKEYLYQYFSENYYFIKRKYKILKKY